MVTLSEVIRYALDKNKLDSDRYQFSTVDFPNDSEMLQVESMLRNRSPGDLQEFWTTIDNMIDKDLVRRALTQISQQVYDKTGLNIYNMANIGGKVRPVPMMNDASLLVEQLGNYMERSRISNDAFSQLDMNRIGSSINDDYKNYDDYKIICRKDKYCANAFWKKSTTNY